MTKSRSICAILHVRLRPLKQNMEQFWTMSCEKEAEVTGGVISKYIMGGHVSSWTL